MKLIQSKIRDVISFNIKEQGNFLQVKKSVFGVMVWNGVFLEKLNIKYFRAHEIVKNKTARRSSTDQALQKRTEICPTINGSNIV